MLLTNRLNSALVLLTLLGAVACAEDDAAGDDTSALDAGDDTDDDAGAGSGDDDADDDVPADDDADDDVSDEDAGGDDDVSDEDAGADDDVSDEDAGGDDDVSGDDDVDAAAPDAGDDDVGGDDDVDAGDDDVDAGGDDDVPVTVDAGSDAGLPDNGGVCETDEDCNEGATCFEGVCVQAGSGLRLTLTWTGLSDLDIHVMTPSGVQVYWGAPVGGGGFLDVDDCAYDSNQDTFACIDPTGTHVESIFFEMPEAGEYTVAVNGFQTNGETIDFTVQPFVDDEPLDLLYGSVAQDEFAEATLEYTP